MLIVRNATNAFKLFFKQKHFEKRLSKILKKSNFIFVFRPSLFTDVIMIKGSWNLIAVPLQVAKYVQKCSFFGDPSSGQFGALNQRDFSVIQEATNDNLRNFCLCVIHM